MLKWKLISNYLFSLQPVELTFHSSLHTRPYCGPGGSGTFVGGTSSFLQTQLNGVFKHSRRILQCHKVSFSRSIEKKTRLALVNPSLRRERKSQPSSTEKLVCLVTQISFWVCLFTDRFYCVLALRLTCVYFPCLWQHLK